MPVYMHPRDPSGVRFWPSLIPVQDTAPASSAEVWVDTSTTPPVIRAWNGSMWAAIADTLTESLLGTSDLDAVKTPGNYVQGTAANATLARHYPVATVTGHLQVTSDGAGSPALVHQVWTSSSTNDTYVRTYSAAAWSVWEAIGTGNDGTVDTLQVTLTEANQLITLPAAPFTGTAVTVILTQDAAGGRTATWPSSVSWDGGFAPTLTPTPGARDVFTFLWLGADWLGFVSGTFDPAPAAPDTTAPSTPTVTAGTPTQTTIPVTWTTATDNVAVAGYEVSTDGTTWTNVGNVTAHTFTGLAQGTSYTLRVRAYDAAGNRGTAGTATATTAAPDTTAPSVPTGLTATATGASTVNLTWVASSDNIAVAGYEYRIGTGAAVDVGNVTAATVSGLTAGTAYAFSVRAYDEAGNRSSWTADANATTSSAAWVDAMTALAPSVWWEVDETTGTTLADSSGNGRAGSIVAGTGSATLAQPSLIPSDAGSKSIALTANAYLTLADAAWMDSTSGYTALCVVKPTADGNEYMLLTRSAAPGPDRMFQLSSAVTTGYATGTVFLTTGTGTNVNTTVNLTDGSPHLVIMTVTATLATLYVDGVSAGSASIASPFFNVALPLSFGARGAGATPNYAGQVDDIAYWADRVLTAAEVADLHTAWSA